MAKTRKTHKKKIYHFSEDGVKDPNIWIEVERLDKLEVEQGQGFHYQGTTYSFKWDDEKEDGTWADSKESTSIKRITNPDNPSQWVDLPVIDNLTLETGKEFHYQTSMHHFDNTKENTARKTHKKTVRNKTDPTMRLDVEVIDNVEREFGKEFRWQATTVSYNDQGAEEE